MCVKFTHLKINIFKNHVFLPLNSRIQVHIGFIQNMILYWNI